MHMRIAYWVKVKMPWTLFILSTLHTRISSEVSPVQTYVGSYANFSFVLTEDPNATIVNIKDKAGVILLSARGSVGVSNTLLYKNRVNFTGNTYQKLISFILRNVTLADAGMYIVVLTNPERTVGSQILIVKASPSKPQIVELEGHAVDGTSYHLNCSAESNSEPPNHNLSMFSEWRRDNTLINSSGRYIVNRTELTITGPSYGQDNGARLICVAFEDTLAKSVNSDGYIIDIKYGPDNVQISPVGDLSVVEGTMLNISCSAECNPVCDSYRWQNGSDNSSLGSSQSLLITRVRREHAGVYFCTVTNSAISKSAKAQVNFTVNYSSILLVTKLSIHADAPDVVVDYSGSSLTNSTVLLTCIASGEPSQYTFHEWIHKFGETEIRKLTGQITANTSILTLPNISIEDMGTYVCTVDNSITDHNGQIIQTGQTDIFVRGTPFIENKNSMFIGTINKSARIEIPFYSNPSSATVKFYKGTNNVEVTNKSDTFIVLSSFLNMLTFYDKEIMLNGQITILHFRTVKPTDYGEYIACLLNDIGSTSRRIVFSSGEPGAPVHFQITDIQEKQVTLQWLSGDHRGFEQTFVVQLSMDNITWTNASLINAGIKEGWLSATITGLKSSTAYYFRLYSFNVNGVGDFADIIVATRTLKDSASSLDIGASLGIGFGGFILGVVGTISVIIIRKRITGTPKYSSRSEADMSTDMQTYANNIISSSTAPSHYEELEQDSMVKTMYDRI